MNPKKSQEAGISRYFIQTANNAECHGIRRNFPENCNSSAYVVYEYPPKIEEAEIKPINENGEIVLSKVVVPEYIVVHDGPVNDSAAGNYYVRYKDYIKNVASSEIYATWPDDTIRANVLAIMSFTLNRFIRNGTGTKVMTLRSLPPLPMITNGSMAGISLPALTAL